MKLATACLATAILTAPATARQACAIESDVRDLGVGSSVPARPYALTVSGFPHPGQSFTVRLAGGRPQASGQLYYSTSPATQFLPVLGATLRIGAPVPLAPIATGLGGADEDVLSLVVPASFCGFELFLQGVVFDADATGGLALTRGLGVPIWSRGARSVPWSVREQ